MSHCQHEGMDPETREAFKRAMAELKGASEEVRQTFLKRGAEIVWQEVNKAEPETPRYEPTPVQAAIKRMSVRGQE